MSSAAALLKRSAVLGFSKFAGQAILFVSPILLVRLLSVAEYGKYREFILYATVAVAVLGFQVASSLPYFIPRHPEKAGLYVAQTVVFAFVTSVVGITTMAVAADYLRLGMSFDFIFTLQLYIFFALNFDFLEMYWLARRQALNILFYSTGRLLVRLSAIVTAAAITGSVEHVIWALIGVEAVRFMLVAAYGFRAGLFSFSISKESVAHQLSYSLPLGTGALVYLLNQNAGNFLVSVKSGAAALAIYVTGAYCLPVVGLVVQAISQVIFPEMVAREGSPEKASLTLWQNATVAYAAMLFPVAALFMLLARPIIEVLFTAQYAESAPVFAVFAWLIVVQCFDFHLPLRLLNQNKYYLVGSVMALALNAALLVPAYRVFGIVGPALALIASQLMLTVYLGYRLMRGYELGISEIVRWGVVGRIALAAAFSATPVLLVRASGEGNWTVLVTGFGVYALAYLACTRLLGLWSRASVGRLLANWRYRPIEGRQ